jgi:hypothetical protein
MCHFEHLVCRSIDLALDAGIATRTSRLVLEDGTRLVLVALKAFVQLAVRTHERFILEVRYSIVKRNNYMQMLKHIFLVYRVL